jgi:hypothetical protein
VIGTALSARSRPHLSAAVGPFANSVILRTVCPSPPFATC